MAALEAAVAAGPPPGVLFTVYYEWPRRQPSRRHWCLDPPDVFSLYTMSHVCYAALPLYTMYHVCYAAPLMLVILVMSWCYGCMISTV